MASKFNWNTFKYTIYTVIVIIILTLTGIFDVFSGREIIEGKLDFSQVLLIFMLAVSGYLAANVVLKKGALSSPQTKGESLFRPEDAPIIAGALGGLIAAVALALVVILEISVDMSFVFQNLRSLDESTLTFGKHVSVDDGQLGGLVILLLVGIGVGTLSGFLVSVPRRIREVALLSVGLTILISLVSGQIDDVIAMPDVLILIITFGVAYIIGQRLNRSLSHRLGSGLGIGAAIAIVILIVAGPGKDAFTSVTEEITQFLYKDVDNIFIGHGDDPRIIKLVNNKAILFVAVLGVTGALGALAPKARQSIHDGLFYFLLSTLLFGIVNWLDDMTYASAFVIFAFIAITLWFAPILGNKAESNYDKQSPQDQRNAQLIFLAGMLPIMLIAPVFMGTYITNVFNLIALYTIMGIGLNVMVGFAGLLDLGYVASFAIGAYTLGIVTAPNVLTCGGVHPKDIPFQDIPTMCKGIEIFFITLPRSFWFAWPICVAVSAVTGMMLGVPVLRLRGDYLAIVTLGFGEIINRLILSNDFLQMEGRPLLGSAQGIAPIPSPSLNLSVLNSDWVTKLSSSTSIYYLFLVGVLIAGSVVYRLIHTRTGRAWRAIRSDEDVAQAMGIHLVNNKLLAFGISSAFAGLGGAVFGASLQGIFPNSFTILVSINVLSLIIIGGMGSISGVILGAFILIGMPELLRELDAYRLLSFGALLVAVMLVKPEGLLPPSPPRLTEKRDEQQSTKETVSHA